MALLRLRERFEARRLFLAAVFIGLAVTSGHPETAFSAGAGGCLIALLHRPAGDPLIRRRLLFFLQSLLVAVLGLALSAVQVLPFFDYLAQSQVQNLRL